MSTQRIRYDEVAPHVLKAMLGLEKALAETQLEPSLRELVKIRASQLNGCAYCVDMHSSDALKAGEQTRRLLSLTTWHETPFFSARERAALLWTETLTLVSERHAPDEIYQQVAEHFNERELAELTFAIATINAWNRIGIGLAMQPE
ncbi:carboxymuconolactone decarboxylase family protein [Crenobacter sp. SG2303]|uniref:Carboxymuconolactone decarboxylase family protein n=1 Tax=Crenobacter oryzisoli TaxID=3056844 RepID=A0ABT7XJ01_9NEIS|nr:carboxymuconolactone decarboxylase family protein [Crenobacter sp. SG2303]MDN0073757.1 carboxymuconolactone decarboxylase family protein [Crenobacter sp. SG2303]